MTDSMIPYSFLPGTKAKAGEVNANFIALADAISSLNENLSDVDGSVENILNNILPEEHFNRQKVTEEDTDIDDYKQKGVYFFSSGYIPDNVPENVAGTLIVLGEEDSALKQFWICDEGVLNIFTRNYSDSSWGDWKSLLGDFITNNIGYVKLPNKMVIQWGYYTGFNITYPIAYSQVGVVVVSKQGCLSNDTTSDEGFVSQGKTGFQYNAYSVKEAIYWIAIGY